MRILLLGEYSNVHATLAKGLKALGHEVVVASNGDYWKNYPRDIDLARNGQDKWHGLWLTLKFWCHRNDFRGFDIVQLINPHFIDLKPSRISQIYKYLKKNNKKIVLGAFGMDYYWVHVCTNDKPLRYSDFNIGDEVRMNVDAIRERNLWIGTDSERLNKQIANECDGIVAGLYEYWVCYKPSFQHKTVFIPFPIEMPETKSVEYGVGKKVRVFIGINKSRNEYKGTDIMLAAAEELLEKYPDRIELIKVENVPFVQYQQFMNGSDLIIDQLYSYTPSMNPLLAMSKGIVCVGGGEPENYEIIDENELRPIINVLPTKESVYRELESVILNPEIIPYLKKQSVEYVQKHHDYIKVAKQYLDFYASI